MKDRTTKRNSTTILDVLQKLQTKFAPYLKAFRIREIANFLLFFFPIRLQIAEVQMAIRCWADIPACLEIFHARIYDPVFIKDSIRTYCDLGCQSGFSFLRLAAIQGAPAQGLLVDGNPEAIKRCGKNLAQLECPETHLLHGVVGWDKKNANGSVPFTIRTNELECSLAQEVFERPESSVICVPAINLEEEWIRRIGPKLCDLLKVDIEGAETRFLQKDSSFFLRVKRCVLEWHGGEKNRMEIIALLQNLGFVDFKVLWEGPRAGVLTCQNLNLTNSSRVHG